MKRALISDIHSNLEAFEAVLADIRSQGITEIFCLGDIIGYGPNPRECIDLVMKCQMCLLGNHDQGALFDPEGFNTGAERAIFWTREQLENPRGNPADNAKRWEFLGELPRSHRDNGFCTCTVRRAIRSTNTCFPKTRFAAPKNWNAVSR